MQQMLSTMVEGFVAEGRSGHAEHPRDDSSCEGSVPGRCAGAHWIQDWPRIKVGHAVSAVSYQTSR